MHQDEKELGEENLTGDHPFYDNDSIATVQQTK